MASTFPCGILRALKCGRAFAGELLKFLQGDFLAGQENREIPLGTRLAALMPTLEIGWQRWDDNRPGERRMGLVSEGFVPPKRSELGDLDERLWDVDSDGKPRDPWQFSNQIVMIDPADGDNVYTFTTSSKGGLGAIGELCRTYGKNLRQQPERIPVIALDAGSYQHRDKSRGRIKFPVFRIIDWAPESDFTAALALARGEPEQADLLPDNKPPENKKF